MVPIDKENRNQKRHQSHPRKGMPPKQPGSLPRKVEVTADNCESFFRQIEQQLHPDASEEDQTRALDLKFSTIGLTDKLKVDADLLEIVKSVVRADVNSISKPFARTLFSIYRDHIPEFLNIGEIPCFSYNEVSVSHAKVFIEIFTKLCHSSLLYCTSRLLHCHEYLYRLMAIAPTLFETVNACLTFMGTFPTSFEEYDFALISKFLSRPETVQATREFFGTVGKIERQPEMRETTIRRLINAGAISSQASNVRMKFADNRQFMPSIVKQLQFLHTGLPLFKKTFAVFQALIHEPQDAVQVLSSGFVGSLFIRSLAEDDQAILQIILFFRKKKH
jgi:hypothetical protein